MMICWHTKVTRAKAHHTTCKHTAKILQNEVKFASCLEGIYKVHNEWMLNLLQDAPLCLSVSRVLRIPYDHSLVRNTARSS